MPIRQAYFSEQTRNDSFAEIINNEPALNMVYKLILINILNNSCKATMQEISAALAIPVNEVSARLNELRNDFDVLFTDGEKRRNQFTNKPNILWKLKLDKFSELTLFSNIKKKSA